MPADMQKARDLFLHAVGKLPPEQWDAYVAEACGGDAGLGQQVAHLLQVHRDAGSFLDHPAAALVATGAFSSMPGDPTATVFPREAAGTQIGPYKLLQQIGEGGMGTVYMAEQTEPVKRKVALKVIKAGMDSRQVIARFEAERQALAMMDHVNIARVFDGGTTENGRPYFVMELVHGVPITKYCDDNHLTPRQRLELFVPVCQAIQHAHQKGIIHRDIKPSNVMITLYDGKPVPKVIDFGVAKATEQKLTERTLFTQYGMMVGTLEYMSPEQAEMSALGVDTRSDIYSLGVLLYELLTGSTPLSHNRIKEAAYAEVLRLIKEEEPPKPSTRLSESGEALASISALRHTEPAKLSKLMRGELDWIVMKTLEKDRGRRYETAGAFAADVQRYLADETVQACPPSRGYRFKKFIRRNKVSATAASVIFLALLLGVLGTSVGLFRAIKAEEMAVDDRNKAMAAETEERQAKLHAVESKQDAERSLAQAIKAADTFFTRVSESKLLDKPGLQPLRKELLQEALKHYQELFHKKKNDPNLKAELAASYLRMAFLLSTLDEDDESYLLMQKGLEVVEELVRQNPGNVEIAQRLADICKVDRPLYRGWCGIPAPSNPHQAMDACKKSCEIWTGLVRAHPTIPGLQNDLATFWLNVGSIHGVLGQTTELQRCYQKAAEISSIVASDSGASVEHRALNVGSRMAYSWTLRINGHTGEAVREAQSALALQEKLTTEFAENPLLMLIHSGALENLANILQFTPRLEEAHKYIVSSIEINEKLVAQYPDLPGFQHQLALAYLTQATGLQKRGNAAAEEKSIRTSWTMAQKVFREHPEEPSCRQILEISGGALAAFLSRTGRPKESHEVLVEELRLREKFLQDFTQSTADRSARASLHRFAATLAENSADYPKAESECRLAIKLYQELATEFPNNVGFQNSADELFDLIRELYIRSGQWDKAIAEFTRAIDLRPDRWGYRFSRGYLYLSHGLSDKAFTDFSKAIELNSELDNPWRLADAWHHRSGIYLGLGQTDKAVTGFTKAIELAPGNYWHWLRRGQAYARLQQFSKTVADCTQAIQLKSDVADFWQTRGDAYAILGQWDKVAADFSKVIELETNATTVALVYARRANAYSQVGRFPEAVADYRKALELAPNSAPAHNDLAWFLSTCSDPKFRDAKRAVELAKKAIDLDQHHGHYRTTLGVAHYRVDRWKDAIDVLIKSTEMLKDDRLGFNAFFLAMSHWKLGSKEEARKWYDKAVAWMDKNDAKNQELRRFQVEASELMGIKLKKE